VKIRTLHFPDQRLERVGRFSEGKNGKRDHYFEDSMVEAGL